VDGGENYRSDRTESKVATFVLSSEPESDASDSEDFDDVSNLTDDSTTTENYRGGGLEKGSKIPNSDELARKSSETRVFRNKIFNSTSDSSDLSPRKLFNSTSDSSDILANGSLSDGGDETGIVLSKYVLSDDVFLSETTPPPARPPPKVEQPESSITRTLPDTACKNTSPKSIKALKGSSLIFYRQDSNITPGIPMPSRIPRKNFVSQISKSENKTSDSNGKVAENSTDTKNSLAKPAEYRTDWHMYVNGGNDVQENSNHNTDIFRGKIEKILKAKSVNAVGKDAKCDMSGSSTGRGRRKSCEQLEKSSPNHSKNTQTGNCEMNVSPSESYDARKSSLFNGHDFPSSYRRNSSGKVVSTEMQNSIGNISGKPPHRDGASLIPKLDLNMKTMPCALPAKPYKGNLFPAELSRKESRVPRLNGSHYPSRNLQNIFPETKFGGDKIKMRCRSSSVMVTTLCDAGERKTDAKDTQTNKSGGSKDREKKESTLGLNRQYRSQSCDNILETCDAQKERYTRDSCVRELSRGSRVGKDKPETVRQGTDADLRYSQNAPDTSKGILKGNIERDMCTRQYPKLGRERSVRTDTSNNLDNPSDNELNYEFVNSNKHKRHIYEKKKDRITGYDMVSGKSYSYEKCDKDTQKDDSNRVMRRRRRSLKDPKEWNMEHHLRAFSQAVTRSDKTEDVDVDTLSSVGSEQLQENWILKPKHLEDTAEKEAIELKSCTYERKTSLARTKSEAGHKAAESISKSGAQKESQFSRLEKSNLNRSKTFSMASTDFIEVDKVKKKIEELRHSKIELSSVSKLAGFFWSKKDSEKDESVDFCQNKTHDICRYLQQYRSESAINAEKERNRNSRRTNKADNSHRPSLTSEYELHVVQEKGSYPLSELQVDLHRQRKKHRRRYSAKNRPASEIKDSVFGDLTDSQTDLVLEKLSRKSPFLKLKDINSTNCGRHIDRWKNLTCNQRLTPQPRRRHHSTEDPTPQDLQKRCESLEIDINSVAPELRPQVANVEERKKTESIPETPNLRRKDYHGSVDNLLDSDSPKQAFNRQQDSRRSIRRNHAMRRSKRPSEHEHFNQENSASDNHGLVYKTMDRRSSYDGLEQKPRSLHKTLSVPNMSLKPKLEVCTKSVSPAKQSYESASGSNTSSPDPSPKRSILGFFQSFSKADKDSSPRKKLRRSQTFTNTFDRVYRPRSHSDHSFTTSTESWTSTIDELERYPVVGRKVSFLRKLASEQIDDLSQSVEDMQNHIRTAVKRIQSSFDEEKAIEEGRRHSASSDTSSNRKSAEEFLVRKCEYITVGWFLWFLMVFTFF
jgi:hypothetical protein